MYINGIKGSWQTFIILGLIPSIPEIINVISKIVHSLDFTLCFETVLAILPPTAILTQLIIVSYLSANSMYLNYVERVDTLGIDSSVVLDIDYRRGIYIIEIILSGLGIVLLLCWEHENSPGLKWFRLIMTFLGLVGLITTIFAHIVFKRKYKLVY